MQGCKHIFRWTLIVYSSLVNMICWTFSSNLIKWRGKKILYIYKNNKYIFPKIVKYKGLQKWHTHTCTISVCCKTDTLNAWEKNMPYYLRGLRTDIGSISNAFPLDCLRPIYTSTWSVRSQRHREHLCFCILSALLCNFTAETLVGGGVSMFHCVVFLRWCFEFRHHCFEFRLLQTIATETERIILELELIDVEKQLLLVYY